MTEDFCWNVYCDSFNRQRIEVFNVFNHGSFRKEVLEILKKDLSREEKSTEIRKIAMYYFWAKSEYETVITSWPPYIRKEAYDKMRDEVKDTDRVAYPELAVSKKIDIYDQLMLNWDAFIDYLLSLEELSNE